MTKPLLQSRANVSKCWYVKPRKPFYHTPSAVTVQVMSLCSMNVVLNHGYLSRSHWSNASSIFTHYDLGPWYVLANFALKSQKSDWLQWQHGTAVYLLPLVQYPHVFWCLQYMRKIPFMRQFYYAWLLLSFQLSCQLVSWVCSPIGLLIEQAFPPHLAWSNRSRCPPWADLWNMRL